MVSKLAIVLLSVSLSTLAVGFVRGAESPDIDEDELVDMVLQVFEDYNIKVNNKEKIIEGVKNMSNKEDVMKVASFIRNSIRTLKDVK